MMGKVVVFDDRYSWGHLGLGIIYCFSCFSIQLAILLCYLMYQYVDEDELEEKLGDIVEFLVGVLVGYVAKIVLLLLTVA